MMFVQDFSEQYGTTNQFHCHDKYPIIIEKDQDIYHIGVKRKDSRLPMQ